MVPRYDVPVDAKLGSASGRTRDGPQPNRPSEGSKSSGMRTSGTGAGGVTFHMLSRPTRPLSRIWYVPRHRLRDDRGMGRISRRVSAIAPSATLAVDAKAKALQAAGEDVINLGPGEPD